MGNKKTKGRGDNASALGGWEGYKKSSGSSRASSTKARMPSGFSRFPWERFQRPEPMEQNERSTALRYLPGDWA